MKIFYNSFVYMRKMAVSSDLVLMGVCCRAILLEPSCVLSAAPNSIQLSVSSVVLNPSHSDPLTQSLYQVVMTTSSKIISIATSFLLL